MLNSSSFLRMHGTHERPLRYRMFAARYPQGFVSYSGQILAPACQATTNENSCKSPGSRSDSCSGCGPSRAGFFMSQGPKGE